MKNDLGTASDQDFESWLGGEAHVRVPRRHSGLWLRVPGWNAIGRAYALAGLVVGVIIGISATTAFFHGRRHRMTGRERTDTIRTNSESGPNGT